MFAHAGEEVAFNDPSKLTLPSLEPASVVVSTAHIERARLKMVPLSSLVPSLGRVA